MRIPKPDVKAFKVELTEHDRGFGVRHWDTWYFDNEQEARNAAHDYNHKYNTASEAPDWYVIATYAGEVR